jgi:hypothetical protein
MKTNIFNLIIKVWLVIIVCLLIAIWSEAATTFYVDPDYTGSTKNGAASPPWNSLGSWGSSQWNAINSALASGNVTVYFSCKHYSNAANETTTTALNICRTAGTGTYRLTLDGNAMYYNDSSQTSDTLLGSAWDKITRVDGDYIYLMERVLNAAGTGTASFTALQ